LPQKVLQNYLNKLHNSHLMLNGVIRLYHARAQLVQDIKIKKTVFIFRFYETLND